jgi:acetyl esterase/lipase
MKQAVANLFEDDNTALADSALAAGYTGPIPDRVVLVGHSLGGGLVAGTAGYMVDNDTVDRLAGVLMLDGVGLDGSMTTSLEKVPDDIPIYQLAAPK